jgi:hypothetical protein
MHLPIKVKSPYNISKWHMEFNSAFKGLILILRDSIKITVGSISWYKDTCKMTRHIKAITPFHLRNFFPKVTKHFPLCVDKAQVCSKPVSRKWNRGRGDKIRSKFSFIILSNSSGNTLSLSTILMFYALFTLLNTVSNNCTTGPSYLLTPWRRFLLEKLTSKLCS